MQRHAQIGNQVRYDCAAGLLVRTHIPMGDKVCLPARRPKSGRAGDPWLGYVVANQVGGHRRLSAGIKRCGQRIGRQDSIDGSANPAPGLEGAIAVSAISCLACEVVPMIYHARYVKRNVGPAGCRARRPQDPAAEPFRAAIRPPNRTSFCAYPKNPRPRPGKKAPRRHSLTACRRWHTLCPYNEALHSRLFVY